MNDLLPLLLSAPFALGPVAAPAPAPSPAGRALSAPSALVVEAPSGAVVPDADAFDRLARARVVYVGERHDEALHHGVQLEVLKALHARRPGLVLGLEMVDRGRQASLDAWLAGRMPDADFAAFWKAAWGFDFALYEPLLRFAKANGIPVRGLNAPIAVIGKVYRGGLASLTPAERALLAAKVEQTSDPAYLAYLTRVIDESHGHPPPAALANMLEAQAAWNETMGESVAGLLSAGAGPVLVVAGTGHMVHRAGIAESVSRRVRAEQSVVLPWPDGGGRAPAADMLRELRDPRAGLLSLADWFWLLPD